MFGWYKIFEVQKLISWPPFPFQGSSLWPSLSSWVLSWCVVGQQLQWGDWLENWLGRMPPQPHKSHSFPFGPHDPLETSCKPLLGNMLGHPRCRTGPIPLVDRWNPSPPFPLPIRQVAAQCTVFNPGQAHSCCKYSSCETAFTVALWMWLFTFHLDAKGQRTIMMTQWLLCPHE